MIKLTKSQQFLTDLESAFEWLYFKAIKENKDTDKLEESFRSEFIKKYTHVKINPFIYSAYGSHNPTRRAVFFHGLYVIEYQIIPFQSSSKEDIEEVVFIPTAFEFSCSNYMKVISH